LSHPVCHDTIDVVKNIYSNLIRETEKHRQLALATLLDTRGSVPQVRGATALFSADGLVSGTLGGGVLEADATHRAGEAIRNGSRDIYEFDLNADISSKEAAICGGTALVLIDACLEESREVFQAMEQSIRRRRSGILLTTIGRQPGMMIGRQWFERASGKYWQEMLACLDERKCLYLGSPEGEACFIEPIFPLPGLIIAGAGHIGKALAHLGRLLDFEVTVIDDRAEYANSANIPDVDHLMVGNIGQSLRGLAGSPESYVVIVTRGHKDDAEALRACLDKDVAYIGMIGSKRKISLMRKEFISSGWATPAQFDRVHAPIGLEIGSKTVQEIAVSISAQLVQVRHQRHWLPKKPSVTAIILAAGASSRMGKPKLLLPFGDSTVIGTVINEVLASSIRHAIVVLGARYEAHHRAIRDYPVEIIHNKGFRDGMLSSVKCGLEHVPETAEAVMILLGDQPMVTSDEMDRLLGSYVSSEKGILVATHGSKRGHPILIGRKFLSEIRGFSVESSLRHLLEIHPDEILEIQTENDRILRDIDTEKDYVSELKHHHKHD
jgi:xanthine/CO dehydrogenase XdhC/CoxF family maturation factor/CTP:molybdopterin cytidylyltransferase MocA